MVIVGALVALLVIYLLWKLFVDGYLFKIPLFFGGWFGIYILMRVYVEGSKGVAVVIDNTGFTWAAVVPTAICVMALLCSKVRE